MSTLARPLPAASAAGQRPPEKPRAILVVDDHDLVRLGVCALLKAQSSAGADPIEVLEADNLADALRIYDEGGEAIELVLLDLALPDTQGLSGLVAFRARHPRARIVALSGTGTTSLAQDTLAYSAMSQGADAFLPKSANLKEVVSFIRACGLLGGDVVHSPLVAPAASPAPPRPLPSSAQQRLTRRQQQVFNLLLEGRTNHEIAELAALSEGTVKNYVSGILLLFGVRSRAQLISNLR